MLRCYAVKDDRGTITRSQHPFYIMVRGGNQTPRALPSLRYMGEGEVEQ